MLDLSWSSSKLEITCTWSLGSFVFMHDETSVAFVLIVGPGKGSRFLMTLLELVF